jgi:sensor histidine kinase regulating citrate/malate metabolism
LQALGAVDEVCDGIVVVNAVGMIVAINRAAYEMFEYSEGELETKSVRWGKAECCGVDKSAGSVLRRCDMKGELCMVVRGLWRAF